MSKPIACLALPCLIALSTAHAQIVENLSSPPDPYALGTQANETNEHYGAGALSDDNRYVVIDTRADNLIAGDDNHDYDTYLIDRTTGARTLVSHRPDGRPGSGESYEGAISGDGRFVAFHSYANDLVANDHNGKADVFVFDRLTGAVERVSIGAGGVEGDDNSFSPSLSRDGRYVAFVSSATTLGSGDTNGADDVYVRDRQLGVTFRASVAAGGGEGNATSFLARIDAAGRRLCFVSYASNLVGDDGNGQPDVFVRDLALGTTALISRGIGGAVGNGRAGECAIAADSGAVAFSAQASNLVPGDTNGAYDVFVYEEGVGLSRIDPGAGGAQNDANATDVDISADGRFVAFDTPAGNLPGPHSPDQLEVYVHDRVTHATTRVSLATSAQPSARYSDFPRLSSDGSLVVYNAFADDQVAGDTNLKRDALLFTMATGARSRVLQAGPVNPSGGGGAQPAESADGRYVAFASSAPILAPGVANGLGQIYLIDTATRALTLVSRTASGQAANGDSYGAAISGDARFVAYLSRATNLVAGSGANPLYEVFLYDRQADSTTRISSDPLGNAADRDCGAPALAADASRIAFTTMASNLLPGASTPAPRVLVFDRIAGSFARGDVGPAGELPNGPVFDRPSLSADGRYLAYSSNTNNIVPDANPWFDVFRKDLVGGELRIVSRRPDGGAPDNHSTQAAISADGRYVAYSSTASDLVAGDDNGTYDIFRTDVQTGTTIRVTHALTGASTATQRAPAISADGRYVAFESTAALVPGDANARSDVYVYDALRDKLARASLTPAGAEYAADSFGAAISADGRWLAFNVSPSVVALPARFNAPTGADVFDARNLFADRLFDDGFE